MEDRVIHLRNVVFKDAPNFLAEQRQEWGNQVHIGPPHPEEPGDREMIGVYLDEAAIPL